MASIKITELNPIGAELFQDSESFLDELTDREMWGVEGGVLSLLGLLSATLSESLSQTFGAGGFNITGPDSAQSLINLQDLLVISGGKAP
ncbi:hypothetical protein WA1_07375 [Scytonema hofmannii PCC 7110]|uniref:Bacteriocin n=1 Tax=Scytonema hofmannii PCC 7110 TaxID=128403 RepID=A0A139WT79_9CYAN|nr:hypothetical protein [Scytonema hofmannii]KYC35629.1 hypothetical protein WA1_07375 [Scytonema hofmannii PCC 7110]